MSKVAALLALLLAVAPVASAAVPSSSDQSDPKGDSQASWHPGTDLLRLRTSSGSSVLTVRWDIVDIREEQPTVTVDLVLDHADLTADATGTERISCYVGTWHGVQFDYPVKGIVDPMNPNFCELEKQGEQSTRAPITCTVKYTKEFITCDISYSDLGYVSGQQIQVVFASASAGTSGTCACALIGDVLNANQVIELA